VAYDPTDHLYHMFVAELANNCGLETWHPNCRVVHATSTVPEGPYVKVQLVLDHYACGPSVARDPVTGTWVLTHLGVGIPDNRPDPIAGIGGLSLKFCKNGNSYNTSNMLRSLHPWMPPHSGGEGAPAAPGKIERAVVPTGSQYMLFADSPYGPWRNGTKAPNPGSNSVPLFFPNGSVLISMQGPRGVGLGACRLPAAGAGWVLQRLELSLLGVR
jgi:hypothetical protein